MANEVTLKVKEAQKLGVIEETLQGRMTVKTAANILGLSERQIYRLREKVRQDGAQALVHGNRDRPPSHTKPVEERQRVVELYQQKYKGYNFTHFSEALASEQGLQISDETVRRWLRTEGLGGTIRKTRKHRKRRQRKAREGEMVFLDGSPHHWFGNELPPCTLLLSCDDATSKPLVGLFQDQEDRDGCFLVLKRLFQKFGLPHSLYLDRASQFKTTRHGGLHSAQSQEGPTQFQRAMDELSIHIHFAHSPQARGRIERMNGVFQDRLVAELAHRGITSIPEANRYLNQSFIPAYAKRFGVDAREPDPAWRPVPPGLDLFDVLCVKESRVVANDNTISYRGTIYQLQPAHGRQHFVKASVEVRCRPDGTVRIHHASLGRIPFRKLPKSSKAHDKGMERDYAWP